MTGRKEMDAKFKARIENRLKNYPEYLSGYYYARTRTSIRTNCTYINIIAKFLDNLKKPINEVNRKDIDEYLYVMNGEDKSTHKATTCTALKSFFKYLESVGEIASNPMADIERPRVLRDENERVDYLTEDEIKQYLRAVHNGAGNWLALKRQETMRSRDIAMIMMFLCTGMRCSALNELNIDDLDFENNSITITTKGQKKKVYNGLQDVFEYIKEYLKTREQYVNADCNALFITKRGQRISYSAIQETVTKYAVNINGKRITPHKLRATYATTLYNNGVDLLTLKDLMGHANIETTKVYIRGRENKTADAANIMSKFL